MTYAQDAAVGGYQSLSLLDPFQLQRSFLTTWLRSTRATLELAASSQQLLYDRGRALADAMVDSQPGAEFPIASSQRAWQALLDWWVAGVSEAQGVAEAALVELRFSAGELLGQLEREQTAHQQTQTERDRARERVEREQAGRRQTEQERNAAQARADRLETERRRFERAAQRLERELAEHKARLERVERDRDQQRERADREQAERQQLERTLAEAQQPTAASSTEKPAVNVVRRDDDWAVVRENAKRASGVFDTKREAVDRAREIASHDDVEVHVQPAKGSGAGG